MFPESPKNKRLSTGQDRAGSAFTLAALCWFIRFWIVAPEVLSLVYTELKRIAAQKMTGETPGHTLQPTALVHEAWLKLVGDGEGSFENRAHFFSAAAEAMRRILIDSARRKRAIRRGSGAAHEELQEDHLVQNVVSDEQELAQLNYDRGKELYGSKLISKSDFDQLRVNLSQATAQVKTRRAFLESAQVDLSRTTIHAPIDGVVITRKVEAGQTVAAAMTTPTLFTIANDLHKMQIEAAVSEADIGGVEEGQKVQFTVDAFPGRLSEGGIADASSVEVIEGLKENDQVVSGTFTPQASSTMMRNPFSPFPGPPRR